MSEKQLRKLEDTAANTRKDVEKTHASYFKAVKELQGKEGMEGSRRMEG